MKTDILQLDKTALEFASPKKKLKDKKLLFIHSAGHGSWMWKNFLLYFAENGHEAFALNLRGHYLAPKVDDWGEVGVDAYLDDIDEAVKRIGGPLVLVGHSMSGLLVLKYAETHDVQGLIVSQSGPPKPVLDRRGIKIDRPRPAKTKKKTDKVTLPLKDRAMISSVLFDKDNVDPESIDLVVEHMGEESVRAAGEIMTLEIDARKIDAPVFVLGFDTKKLGMKIEVDINKIMAEEFNAESLVVIEPGGHNYMLERNWQDYAVQFEKWID